MYTGFAFREDLIGLFFPPSFELATSGACAGRRELDDVTAPLDVDGAVPGIAKFCDLFPPPFEFVPPVEPVALFTLFV